MKRLFLMLLYLASPLFMKGQISIQDIRPLLIQLEEKDYKDAHETAQELLIRFERDSSYSMGIVRYAYLYSGAALIDRGKLDYEDLREMLPQLQGQLIRMAVHPSDIDTNNRRLNTNVFYNSEGASHCRTISGNADEGRIYLYEDFEFNIALEPQRIRAKLSRCGGLLEKVEFNRGDTKNWIMRLYIANADLQVL